MKQCAVCGEQFASDKPVQRYCSAHCRNRRPRPPRNPVELTCEQCGVRFKYAHHSGSEAGRKRYCGPACSEQARHDRRKHWPKSPVYFYSCLVCSSMFSSRLPCSRPRCSSACSDLLGNHSLESLHQPLSCVECGQTWMRWERPGKYRYCSDDCAKRKAKRVAKRRRRAMIRSAPNVESVDIRVVADRDGWMCHLCNDPVSKGAWSIDHLVPLSKGGDHTYSNVKLAHHRCNTLRRATPVAEYLAS
jgi:hypothetical protein